MVIDLPPCDRGKDESKLDEQDFAWWTKQLGREPRRSGRAAAPSSAPANRDRMSVTESPQLSGIDENSLRRDETDLSDALREADEAGAAEEHERAATTRESLRQPENRSTTPSPPLAVTDAPSAFDAASGQRTEAPPPRPGALLHDPIAEATRARTAARLIHGLHAVLYSSHHPYPAVRRAAGYMLIFVCAALIAWLLALPQ